MDEGVPRRRVIVATSDLHADITNPVAIQAMRDEIQQRCAREGLDVAALLVLGDVGESLKGIEECLGILRELAPVRLFIPGNHDLFDTERIGSSVTRYEEILPRVVTEQGFSWGIGERPTMIDDVTAIVTTTAWPQPELTIGDVHLEAVAVREAHHYLPDDYWITKDLRHRALSDAQHALFEKALAAVPPDATRLIVGTHYPLFCEQLEKTDAHPSMAWYVSPRFGVTLRAFHERRPDVSLEVVSGHLHRAVRVDARGIPARVILSGYRAPGCVLIPV
jgi:metallophosphoesterase superfamily enzyme